MGLGSNGHKPARAPKLRRFLIRHPPPGVAFTAELRSVLPVRLWVVSQPFRGGCAICRTMHEILNPQEYPVLFGVTDPNRSYHVCLCMGEFVE